MNLTAHHVGVIRENVRHQMNVKLNRGIFYWSVMQVVGRCDVTPLNDSIEINIDHLLRWNFPKALENNLENVTQKLTSGGLQKTIVEAKWRQMTVGGQGLILVGTRSSLRQFSHRFSSFKQKNLVLGFPRKTKLFFQRKPNTNTSGEKLSSPYP